MALTPVNRVHDIIQYYRLPGSNSVIHFDTVIYPHFSNQPQNPLRTVVFNRILRILSMSIIFISIIPTTDISYTIYIWECPYFFVPDMSNSRLIQKLIHEKWTVDYKVEHMLL